jgi:hypothetical protein
VKVPSLPVDVPNDELLKNTLAPGTGALVSADVIVPLTVTLCAQPNVGNNNNNNILNSFINRFKTILNGL